MAVSNELMLAILAMDAYNRGYGAGVVVSGDQLGTAVLGRGTNELTEPEAVAASFFAQAYTWNGRTVISYRGTDTKNLGPGGDIWNGYGVGDGSPLGAQAELAVAFYKEVAGSGADLRSANIMVTGHSLGGGLAGFVGALYGRTGLLYDHMPFENAAREALALAKSPLFPSGYRLLEQIYGNATPWEVKLDDLSGYYIPAAPFGYGLGPASNWLATFRRDPSLPARMTAYELPPEAANSWSYSYNSVGERHDASVLVMRMFAGGPNLASAGFWQHIAGPLFEALFSHDVAKATGAKSLQGGGSNGSDFAGYLRTTIAYSAVDVGERPFGDSAIRALFDDADELGKVYAGGDLNYYLSAGFLDDRVKSGLAEIAVQYAGDLALQKAVSDETKKGTFELSEDGSRLKAEFDPEKWRATFNTGATEGGQEKIVGLEKIAAGLEGAIRVSGTFTERNDALDAAFAEFTAAAGAGYTDVTWLEVAATASTPVTLDATAAVAAKSGAPGGAILLGGDAGSTYTGSTGADLIIGGDGDDVIRYSPGRDLVFGGKGADTYLAGDGALPDGVTDRGRIIYFGGAGKDIADYALLPEKAKFKPGVRLGDLDITNPHKDEFISTVEVPGAALADLLFGVEEVKGTSRADEIVIDKGFWEQARDLGEALLQVFDLGLMVEVLRIWLRDGVELGDYAQGERVELRNIEGATATGHDDVVLGVDFEKVTAEERVAIDLDLGKGDDFATTRFSRGKVQGGEGDDVVVALKSHYEASPESGPRRLTVDGGEGADALFALGGTGAILIGGEGRDFLFNASEFGETYGDTIDSAGQSTTGADDSDVFWYWPGTFIMDAQPNDILQIFGFPLLGGGSVGDSNGAFARDRLVWGTYCAATLSWQLIVYNSIANMLKKGTNEGGFAYGVMVVENYDFGGYREDEANFKGFGIPKPGDLGLEFRIFVESGGDFEIRSFKAIWGTLRAFADQLLNLSKLVRWQPVDDPLVLDLDGDGIETVSVSQSGVYFDVDSDYFADKTDGSRATTGSWCATATAMARSTTWVRCLAVRTARPMPISRLSTATRTAC